MPSYSLVWQSIGPANQPASEPATEEVLAIRFNVGENDNIRDVYSKGDIDKRGDVSGRG
jgi:hypothetical protein